MYLTCFLHPNLCSAVQNLTVSPMFMKHRLHSAQQPLHSIQRARLWRHMASSSGATWLHPLAPHGFILWRHMASSQCSEDREPEVQRPIVCCAVCLLCMRDHGNILRILPRLTMRMKCMQVLGAIKVTHSIIGHPGFISNMATSFPGNTSHRLLRGSQFPSCPRLS